jgi:Flp pilus assembly CpaE family ATPase
LLASDLAFDSPPHRSEALVRIAELGCAAFSHVVIDTGRVVEPAASAVIQRSELVVIVTRLDVVAVVKTRRMVEFLIESGISEDKLVLLANRCGQPGELGIKAAERALGRKFGHCLPDEPRTVNGSVNVGNPVVLEAPSARVSKVMKRMCHELVTGLHAGAPGAMTLSHAMTAN